MSLAACVVRVFMHDFGLESENRPDKSGTPDLASSLELTLDGGEEGLVLVLRGFAPWYVLSVHRNYSDYSTYVLNCQSPQNPVTASQTV